MRYRFQSRQQVFEVALEREGDTYLANIDGQPYRLEILDLQPGVLSLRFEGKPITLYWAADGSQKWISRDGCTYRLEKPAPRTAHPQSDGGGQAVTAPMPAQVREIQVSEGDRVQKGQPILLLEAMKMEIQIKAPAGGQVERLLVKNGQAVDKDQVLAEITEIGEQSNGR